MVGYYVDRRADGGGLDGDGATDMQASMEVAPAAMPAVVPEPPRGLALVRCDRFACVLLATACARRCTARYPSGARRGASRFPACAGCVEGAAVVARLEARGWRRPRDSQPADVLNAAQRAGRDRWVRSFAVWAEPEAAPVGDPLADAAASTPNDSGEPADLG